MDVLTAVKETVERILNMERVETTHQNALAVVEEAKRQADLWKQSKGESRDALQEFVAELSDLHGLDGKRILKLANEQFTMLKDSSLIAVTALVEFGSPAPVGTVVAAAPAQAEAPKTRKPRTPKNAVAAGETAPETGSASEQVSVGEVSIEETDASESGAPEEPTVVEAPLVETAEKTVAAEVVQTVEVEQTVETVETVEAAEEVGADELSADDTGAAEAVVEQAATETVTAETAPAEEAKVEVEEKVEAAPAPAPAPAATPAAPVRPALPTGLTPPKFLQSRGLPGRPGAATTAS